MNSEGITIKRVNIVRKNGANPSKEANIRIRIKGVDSRADWYAIKEDSCKM